MGCAQSKTSHKSSLNQKKRGKVQRSRTSARPVLRQISTLGGKVDDTNSQVVVHRDVHNLGDMAMPDEKQALKNQATVRDEFHGRQLQPTKELAGAKNVKGVTEHEHVGCQPQKPEGYSDPAHFELPINPELEITTAEVSAKIGGNTTFSANGDSNLDKHLVAHPAAASSTNDGRNISSAMKPSFYEGLSFPRSEGEVPENYVDATNPEGLDCREYTPDGIPSNWQEDAPMYREADNEPISSLPNVAKINHRVLRNCESDLMESNSSKFMGSRLHLSETDSSLKKDQPKQNNTDAQKGKPDVDVSRLMESNELAAEDIGSICIDAKTGEYKFYQHGVLTGYVDREEALRLSNDWPICPGTTANRIQREGCKNFPEQASSAIYGFSERPSRSQAFNDYQVNRGQAAIHQPMGRYLKNDANFSNEFNRELGRRTVPGYRGYYM